MRELIRKANRAGFSRWRYRPCLGEDGRERLYLEENQEPGRPALEIGYLFLARNGTLKAGAVHRVGEVYKLVEAYNPPRKKNEKKHKR